ncbi:hypothetical protein NEICINOT_03111 [Neisseria cinerea ATCC 14685]|uniref:Uncharacterized protein n=1 Tax=Neisseria cinerea ATCC 14685 TaxID=546262 RepID=D0W0E5_NEICI|nr:hypothetical protein NEICINOT_03111 [Neisseria cinerea ATCC 14685]
MPADPIADRISCGTDQTFFQVFPCFQDFFNFLKTLNLNYRVSV